MNIEGLDEVLDMLDGAAKNVDRKVGGALGRGADRIRDTARSSAEAKWGGNDTDTTVIESRREASGDPAGYVFMEGGGAYQEHGTSRHPANPVLMPAADKHIPGIVKDVQEAAGDW